jgi:CheY-like chemotaxis protein
LRFRDTTSAQLLIPQGEPLLTYPLPLGGTIVNGHGGAKAMSTQHSVLIIDDTEMVCRMAMEVLKNHSYAASFVTTPAEAMTLLESFIPDIIILDFFLEGMNGDEFLEWLRDHGNPDLRDTPVLGLSINPDTGQKFRRAGANAFITKPLKEGALITAVEALLGAQGWSTMCPWSGTTRCPEHLKSLKEDEAYGEGVHYLFANAIRRRKK